MDKAVSRQWGQVRYLSPLHFLKNKVKIKNTDRDIRKYLHIKYTCTAKLSCVKQLLCDMYAWYRVVKKTVRQLERLCIQIFGFLPLRKCLSRAHTLLYYNKIIIAIYYYYYYYYYFRALPQLAVAIFSSWTLG
jgi:hypothetical protein